MEKEARHLISLKKIKELDKVIGIFKNHFKGVVNALVYSFSNAMAERLNGKIQEIKKGV